jgi:hypothetical protein
LGDDIIILSLRNFTLRSPGVAADMRSTSVGSGHIAAQYRANVRHIFFINARAVFDGVQVMIHDLGRALAIELLECFDELDMLVDTALGGMRPAEPGKN